MFRILATHMRPPVAVPIGSTWWWSRCPRRPVVRQCPPTPTPLPPPARWARRSHPLPGTYVPGGRRAALGGQWSRSAPVPHPYGGRGEAVRLAARREGGGAAVRRRLPRGGAVGGTYCTNPHDVRGWSRDGSVEYPEVDMGLLLPRGGAVGGHTTDGAVLHVVWINLICVQDIECRIRL